MRQCLAEGYPFVFGFTVYTAFMSSDVAKSGVLNMPQPGETVEGGHAVVGVGYDDAQKRFLVRNSWGSGWGMKGYYTMPYDYLSDRNLSDDFWTVRRVEHF
jgi:C1A family cysteine protease